MAKNWNALREEILKDRNTESFVKNRFGRVVQVSLEKAKLMVRLWEWEIVSKPDVKEEEVKVKSK